MPPFFRKRIFGERATVVGGQAIEVVVGVLFVLAGGEGCFRRAVGVVVVGVNELISVGGCAAVVPPELLNDPAETVESGVRAGILAPEVEADIGLDEVFDGESARTVIGVGGQAG